MIDHIGLAVSNMERSKAFYVDALKPLGIAIVMEVTAEQTGADAHAGFGKDDKAFFWIGGGQKPKGGTHIAFAAPTRADVDAFLIHRQADEADAELGGDGARTGIGDGFGQHGVSGFGEYAENGQ